MADDTFGAACTLSKQKNIIIFYSCIESETDKILQGQKKKFLYHIQSRNVSAKKYIHHKISQSILLWSFFKT